MNQLYLNINYIYNIYTISTEYFYNRSSPVACEIEGILVQFCYLSVMLWLNSMSFELGTKFRKLRTFTPQRISGGKNISGWRNPKFKWYAIYSWCLPAFVSFVTIVMQHLPERYTAGKKVYNIIPSL